MMGVRRGWWRSAGVRFGLAYAILFGFSSIAVVALVWRLTAGDVDQETAAAIQRDRSDIDQAFDEGGLRRVVLVVRNLLSTDNTGDRIYLVVNPSLDFLFGTLPGWPREVRDEDVVQAIDLHFGRTVVRARVLPVAFSDGSRVLIGRDVHANTMLWAKLSNAAPWTIAIMALLGVFGAVTLRRLFAAMLADVSKTAAAISAGDLSSRVPITGLGDEFDELAETINEMLERISRLMDGVRGVSNAIAHDLRTPITRARVRLEDAARNRGSAAELHAAVERAIADLDGIVSVFHALLRIAEIEAGSRRSAFAPVDLTAMLRDLVELYEPAAEAGGQVLALDVPDRLMMFGDRDMLQQAVANLLDNALKFSPPETIVGLAAHQLAGQPTTIEVSDQGPGMPDPDRERATERFFRGESARHAPGSGLGLALVQAVAMLHGGALRLEENTPGLRAILTLPPPVMDQVSRAAQPLVSLPGA